MAELIGNITSQTAVLSANLSSGVNVSGNLVSLAKGDKGDIGPAGASAYEVAVQNGFSGTEAEWLNSLKAQVMKQYNTVYEFPKIGDTGTVYVTTGDNSTYRWDDENLKYYCIGRDYTTIEVISGGNENGE